MSEDATQRTAKADEFLSHMSWDRTWARLQKLIDDVVASRRDALKAAPLAASATASAAGAQAQVAGD